MKKIKINNNTDKLLQWIQLSSSNLQHNISLIKSFCEPGVQIGALLKANAYGHGIKEMAFLYYQAKVKIFMAHSLEEALIIKDLNLKNVRIIILGPTDQYQLKIALQNSFEITVYQSQTIKHISLLQKQIAKPALLHVKIETGTQRQGLMVKDIPLFIKELKGLKNYKLMGLSSHFANIEDTSDTSFYQKQLSIFKKAQQKFLSHKLQFQDLHFACSAAVFLYPETHFNIIRPGISLYGYYSSMQLKYALNQKTSLKPVLSWKTRISQIKEVAKNAFIGYGLTYKTTRKTKLAILPIGYYDGYDRKLSNSGVCLIKGKRAFVRGRVCMNMTMIDITDIQDVNVGEEVTLIGKSGTEVITADDLAELANTISYETLARLNPLIPKIITEK